MITAIKEAFDKYNTHDLSQKYEFIGLTKEHIKRLNNAINILESLNEPTDVKYLKEIKDKLLEVNEMKEVDLEKEIKNYFDSQPIITRSKGVDYRLIPTGVDIAKHFFELGLKA